MNSDTVGNAIQLATLLSVVVGIGLVVLELQQQREIAEAQQVFTGVVNYQASLQASMGEEVSTSLANACDDPDALTTKDMHVLLFYYSEILARVRTNYQVSQVTSMKIYNWRAVANGQFATVFSTEYGRWLWNQGSLYVEPEIKILGDEIYAKLASTVPGCRSFVDEYRNRNS